MNDLAEAPISIHGSVAPGFERVREAFAANFARKDDYAELGAALAVHVGGRVVVDLWAGAADTAGRPWQADTLINVYSTTKGVAATAFAMLVGDGRIRYEDRVVQHWPEYGAAGKEGTTVAQLLSHQAGLPGFVEPTTHESLYDWDATCAKLARQAPFWPPGTQTSYHAMTWGFLVGEVFRRAAGMTLGAYIARRIAGPLRADVYLGLPAAEEPRVAQMQPPRSAPDLSNLTQPPQALSALVNPQLDPGVCNQRAWRAAEIPAASGQASALGLSRVYGAIANGGVLDGVSLLSADAIREMTRIQSPRPDLLLGFTGNWSQGFCLNQLGMLGPLPDTFGHGGWGGSLGCADLGARVGIGYVCNQMGAQLVGDPRGTGLCHVIFGCL